MPSFLQLKTIPYDHIAEALFLAGINIEPVSSTEFWIRSKNYSIVFEGEGFVHDVDDKLTEGAVASFRLYQGEASLTNQALVGTSDLDLLTAAEFNKAFSLFVDEGAASAAAFVTESWTKEPFSHTNYSGGQIKGYHNGDVLTGGPLDDTVKGRGGDDLLTLGQGQDVGLGGPGNDFIKAGSGDDTLDGGTGSDQFYGGEGNDLIHGGKGADAMRGDKGDDTLYGDSGHDALIGGRGVDILRGGGGDDAMNGGRNDDLIYGGSGDDTMVGEGGDDAMFGGGGTDLMIGGNGDDSLYGQGGDDLLSGGGKSDLIVGGRGNDLMNGNGGGDTFVFGAASGSDTIYRFDDGSDIISFRSGSFEDLVIEATPEGHATIAYRKSFITLDGFDANLLSAADFDFGV